jgi:hypothetical protein
MSEVAAYLQVELFTEIIIDRAQTIWGVITHFDLDRSVALLNVDSTTFVWQYIDTPRYAIPDNH